MKKILPIDLPIKPSYSRRKTSRTPRKSSPQTPLLRWNIHDSNRTKTRNTDDDHRNATNASPEPRRKQRRDSGSAPPPPTLSSRKLVASLWRHRGDEQEKWRRQQRTENGDDLGFKPEIGQVGHRLPHHHASRDCGLEAKDALKSPGSVNGPINGFLCERQFPFQFSNCEMEGATKWDPVCLKPSYETFNNRNVPDQKVNSSSKISVLEKQLEEAQARIQELESERRSSKKKLQHFLKKLSDERAAWRSREHEKVRAIIDDVKADLSRERKNRHRLEILNSKLVNELAGTKLSAKRYIQDYEKERKSRQLIEEVCDELAKEIGEDKAEVDTLKRECLKMRDEVEDERKMLQMAEVWREERVQMKLIDAKVTLDQKYSQMNQLIFMLEEFLRLKSSTLDINEIREAEMLRQAARSVSIQDMKEFTYEPSKSDDIFAVVEEMAMAETHEKEIAEEYNSTAYVNQNGDVDDDASGWETVSNAEGRGSSNVSGSCTEWEEHAACQTPMTETSDVGSVQSKTFKKVKSITRLWRSQTKNGDNYKIIAVDGMNDGRVSCNGVVGSPDSGAQKKAGNSPLDMDEYGPPESGKPHVSKGMKGGMEWLRGGTNTNLKHRQIESRMQSQKIQLKHVLKQRS